MSSAAARGGATDEGHMRPLVQSAGDAPVLPGSRDWVEYRVFGVEEASDGLVSTRIKRTTSALEEPTGWHHHACDFVWEWVIEGWVDIQFEDGTERRLEAGSVLFMPGGYGHNEVASSDGVEMVELCIPPNPQFVRIDTPPAWRGRAAGG